MKRLISILWMVVLWLSASAAAELTMSNAEGHPGDTVRVSVSLLTESPSAALQVVILLDDQLSYVSGSAQIAQNRVGNSDHQLQASASAGRLTLIIYSASNALIPAGAGELVSFRMILGQEPGSYALNPTAVLSDSRAQRVACDVSGATATIRAPKIRLSANSIDFGHVGIRTTYTEQLQVMNTGNDILHISSLASSSDRWTASLTSLNIAAGASAPLTITYAPETHGAEQGTLTITSDAANGMQTVLVAADPFSVNELHLSSASGESASEVTLTLEMNNMEDIVGFQCVIELPEGIDYVSGSATLAADRSNGHVVAGSVNGRSLSLFAYSARNLPFAGHDGSLMTFRLILNGAGGNYPLHISHAVLSTVAGVNMLSAADDAILRIYGPLIGIADSIDLGLIPIEQPLLVDYPVRNSGEADLTISRICFSDSAHFSCSDMLPITVAAGQEAALHLAFAPYQTGAMSSIMQVYSNDPDRPMIPVRLTGQVYESNYLMVEGHMSDNVYELAVRMDNANSVVALQFDLHWPDGLGLGASDIVLADRAASHSVTVSQLDSCTYRIYLYSLQNREISGSEGEVLRCRFGNAQHALIDGTVILIDNIIISTPEGTSCTTQMPLTYEVRTMLRGDANADGELTVTDVVAVINYTLERPMEAFSFSQADMNNDGVISVADAVLIIRSIINN